MVWSYLVAFFLLVSHVTHVFLRTAGRGGCLSGEGDSIEACARVNERRRRCWSSRSMASWHVLTRLASGT